MEMNNFTGEAEKFSYCIKLNKLNEDVLFLLSDSLKIHNNGNKQDIIRNIIDKLDSLPKGEYLKITKSLDDSLKSQKVINQEHIDENKILEPSINAFDKIFFYFEPEINPNSKIFCCFWCSFCPCCCCFSFSMKTIIIFRLAFLIIYMLFKIGNIFFGYSISNYKIEEFRTDLLSFLSDVFLLISIKNHKSEYARFSLFIKEIILLEYVLNIKKQINFFKKDALQELKICKINNIDEAANCIGAVMGIILVGIIYMLSPFENLYEIYIAYFQLTLTKLKKNKKFE